MARPRAHPVTPPTAVAVVALLSFGFWALLASRAAVPRFFLDELAYMRAGTSLAHGHGLRFRGQAWGYGPLYPIVIGGLVLLGHLGITITPILTALGIGGLAVALALQDTLSNLFAGFHLLADRPVSVGDVVRLENGMEGVVEDIGWRSTRIRQPGEDLIIVPNAKLAQGILTNRLSKRASGQEGSIFPAASAS